jgi:hypothetical protein
VNNFKLLIRIISVLYLNQLFIPITQFKSYHFIYFIFIKIYHLYSLLSSIFTLISILLFHLYSLTYSFYIIFTLQSSISYFNHKFFISLLSYHIIKLRRKSIILFVFKLYIYILIIIYFLLILAKSSDV